MPEDIEALAGERRAELEQLKRECEELKRERDEAWEARKRSHDARMRLVHDRLQLKRERDALRAALERRDDMIRDLHGSHAELRWKIQNLIDGPDGVHPHTGESVVAVAGLRELLDSDDQSGGVPVGEGRAELERPRKQDEELVPGSPEERDAVLMRAGALAVLTALRRRIHWSCVPTWIDDAISRIHDRVSSAEKSNDFEHLS